MPPPITPVFPWYPPIIGFQVNTYTHTHSASYLISLSCANGCINPYLATAAYYQPRHCTLHAFLADCSVIHHRSETSFFPTPAARNYIEPQFCLPLSGTASLKHPPVAWIAVILPLSPPPDVVVPAYHKIRSFASHILVLAALL